MWSNNELSQKLGITYPLIQAPMAGVTTPELVAAVSNSGGLGSLGAALLSPTQIREAVHKIRQLTSHPFAVNLFVSEPDTQYSKETIAQVNKFLDEYRSKLHLAPEPIIKPSGDNFAEQLAVIIAEQVPVFSFTFGVLPKATIAQLKSQGIYTIGTATTVHEAILHEQSGVDFVVAQGSEAGGHRGSAHDTIIEDALIGTMALTPQIVDKVTIPVISSGGIMDGRGVIAALALGTSAAQLGTVFLTCPEATINPEHRAALLQSTDESTRLTRAFTGKMARSIKNKFLLEVEKARAIIPNYYIQSALTKDIRQAAVQQHNTDFMSLWAGQASSLCQTKPAGELFSEIVNEVTSSLVAMRKWPTSQA